MGVHLSNAEKYNRCLLLDHGLPLSSTFHPPREKSLGTLGTTFSTCGKSFRRLLVKSIVRLPTHLNKEESLYYVFLNIVILISNYN